MPSLIRAMIRRVDAGSFVNSTRGSSIFSATVIDPNSAPP